MKKNIIILLIVCTFIISGCLYAYPEQEQTDLLLELFQKSAFDYFIYETGDNGLIQDRMSNKDLSSTLGEGYHLTALCVGAYRGWISRTKAAKEVLKTLKTYQGLDKFHGIFAHYYDIKTGKVVSLMHKEDNGADLSETGFFMAGVILCIEFFDRNNPIEKKIRTAADELYRGVEWDWMLNDGSGSRRKTLAWHWSPDYGFHLGQRIKSDMELSSMITYILAIGSPTHPIPADCWDQGWSKNYRWREYSGKKFIICPPLFAHQYPQTWLDLRQKKDRYADYFRNSTYATLVNREYALDELYKGKDIWGITFCDGPYGYGIYGYPPGVGNISNDAAIAPTATAGSIIFTPEESISSLLYMYNNYKKDLWGKYGFYDSFSLKHKWFDKDYICFDQGVIAAHIENYLSGMVWKYFMKNSYIRTALDKIGFVGVIDDFEKTYGLNSYSKWETQAEIKITNNKFKEGKQSLKISFNKETVLTAEPSVNNLDDYKYISLWLYGNTDIRAAIINNRSAIKYLSKVKDVKNPDGWRHIYFLKDNYNIERINITLNKDANNNSDIYLDAVFASNIINTEIPQKPEDFKFESGYTPGEAVLSFNDSDKPFRYIIKYSEKSLYDPLEFEDEKNTIYLEGYKNKAYISGLDQGQIYFAAIRKEDKDFNVSEISEKNIKIKNADNGKEAIIDDFEDGNLRAPPAEWKTSSNVLKISPVSNRYSDGKYSMKIIYNKTSEMDNWVYIEGQTEYHDYSKHRYLSLKVYGKVNILAKLWNDEDNQQDIEKLSSNKDNEWSELKFDLSKVNNIDKQRCMKLLLFIEPGKTNCSGEVYIDSIKLKN